MEVDAPDNFAPFENHFTEDPGEPMSLDEQYPRDSQPGSVEPQSLDTYLLSTLDDHYNANMSPNAIMAEKLMYTSEIPAHPETSQGGTAYAVRIEHLHPEDAKEPWKALGLEYQTRLRFTQGLREGYTARNLCTKTSFDPTAEVAHRLSGPGKIKTVKCSVQIGFIIPEGDSKWILINSVGEHSHNPPPATRLSAGVKSNLVISLAEGWVANGHSHQPLRQWQQSQQFQDFLRKYNAETVGDINPHLINHSFCSYMVRRHRKIHEPYGSSRKACAHVWQTYHVNQPDQYIRTVINTEADFLAICFTQQQAELWPKIHGIQMDMNYKKITGKSGKVEHEVIFGGRVGLEGQFLALARAYMSSQDAVAYETLFRELFSCLERQCGIRALESIYTL
ncbi:hypothetical protein E4U50_008226 [Claviceps purpurea]|nr:hypothetical protein E4U50_008226 [Claviceps purpurea]